MSIFVVLYQAEFQGLTALISSSIFLFVPTWFFDWPSNVFIRFILCTMIILALTRFFSSGAKCKEIHNALLDGRTFLITGAGGGIGKVTAKELARKGARVVLFARTRNLAQTIEDVRRVADFPDQIVGYAIDLSDLKSIKTCVDEFMANEPEDQPISALINNAGVMACPYTITNDGFEMQMGTNYFGHFYLTKLLLSRLKGARIVNVSSFAHTMWQVPCDSLHYDEICQIDQYNPWRAYALSKAANILFTRELQKRYSISHNIRSYSLHPGLVHTELDRHMGISHIFRLLLTPINWLMLKTPLQGAQTNLFCALSDRAKPGGYHVDCRAVSVLNRYCDDDEVSRNWWDFSEEIIQNTLKEIR